ncbi:hypothetical protein B4N89_44810 [Embleya scabrispora]|uniref:DUF8094 domain-containing protein n=1 Tax=Embleya scabrispora TaxID=159449 RepID=A0A1T3NIA9_9ACTN|nr:hypothetical protein [Embleya scabrispora]OPC76616.1 hypothetical protein B4N89_44810 [Embleya scabrispora]
MAAVAGAVLLAAGCTSSGSGEPASGASATPAVSTHTSVEATGFTRRDAETVFAHYGEVKAQANATRDDRLLAEVEDGPLLAASTGDYAIERAGNEAPKPFKQSDPFVFVPRQQGGHPRYFAVLARNSRWPSTTHGRDLTYFRQERPNDPWKATFSSPINVRNGDAGQPLVDATAPATPFPTPTETFAPDQKAPPSLPAMPALDGENARTLTGEAASKTAGICADFAAYRSRTAAGPTASGERFAPGDRTTGLTGREAETARELGPITWTRDFRTTTDPALPILQLGDGKALVACTFDSLDVTDARQTPGRHILYDKNAKVLRLLGAQPRWIRVERTLAEVAVLAVPPDGAPADVLFSQGTLRAATGTPDE